MEIDIPSDVQQRIDKLGHVIYYLYEIVGKKVGVTMHLSKRQHRQKDKGEMVILGEYTDVIQVSIIERELQAIKGYHVDKHPYWYTVFVQNPKSITPEAIAKQVKNNDFRKASIGSTRKFTEEQVIALREEYKNDVDITCKMLADRENVSVATITFILDGRRYGELPGIVEVRKASKKCKYCGKRMTVNNHNRWHGEHCKKK